MQVRAKSVLGRDLEVLRSKRIAAENPPIPVVEEPTVPASLPAPHTKFHGDLTATTKQESAQEVASMPTVAREEKVQVLKKTVHDEEMIKPTVLSPPKKNGNKPQPIGLGIKTTPSASTDAPATTTAGGHDSSIDALFDNPNSAAHDESTALNFDNMDFTMPDTTTNTQSQGNGQTQNTEFDLSTFGNNPQDFNMNDLQASNETPFNNANSTTTNNKERDMMDELFNMTATTAGNGTNDNNKNSNKNNNNNNNNTNDNNDMDLDLDLNNMVGAEESVFDDMFFAGVDDGNVGGNMGEMGEMEHGQFDNAFFGIE